MVGEIILGGRRDHLRWHGRSFQMLRKLCQDFQCFFSCFTMFPFSKLFTTSLSVAPSCLVPLPGMCVRLIFVNKFVFDLTEMMFF